MAVDTTAPSVFEAGLPKLEYGPFASPGVNSDVEFGGYTFP